VNQQLSQSNVTNSVSSSSINIAIFSTQFVVTELVEFLFELTGGLFGEGFPTVFEAVGVLELVAIISMSGDEAFPT
jgi:hypothetical protein